MFTEWLEERHSARCPAQIRCSINRTAVLYPLLVGRGGLLEGPASSWKLCCCPRGGKVAQGKPGESLASPREHSAPVSSRQAGECFEQVHKREERAGFIFPSFSLCCLPSASVGLVSGLPAPSLLLHTVCLCVCQVFSMPPALPLAFSPILLQSYPPGIGTTHPWAQDFCQPLCPASQTHFPARARPARAEWLNLQPMFSSYSTDVAQGLG